MKEFDIKITCPKCGSNKCMAIIEKVLEYDHCFHWLTVACEDCGLWETGHMYLNTTNFGIHGRNQNDVH